MQARVDWVLKIFGTQVTKKKRSVRPVFPDYLSVSYDYGPIVSFIGTFNYNLASFLYDLLSPLVRNDYSCKDTFSFVLKLRMRIFLEDFLFPTM